MTVCIAALCEDGRKIVVATDRRLSYAGIASDALAGKMLWRGDWLFLYAGAPSQTDLIIEELRHGPTIERSNLQEVVSNAYRKAKAKMCAHAVLSSYDLTMEEFKADGLKMFGGDRFAHLSDLIEDVGTYFDEQLLVIGYGDSPNAANIYEVGKNIASHAIAGIASIGSGAEVALANMLLLNQARYSSLADTIYSVAAAKFAAEMSQDMDVGAKTAMYIAWQRCPSDDAAKPPGTFIEAEEIESLRVVWEKHGRPKIPPSSCIPLWPIVSHIREARSEHATAQDMGLRLSAELQKQQIQDLSMQPDAQPSKGPQ